MKKLFKSILVAALAAMTLCTAAYADEAEKPEVKVLVLGNSLLNHGPNESLGWSGSWGMAASSADKDYYHVLQRIVNESNPGVKVTFTTGSGTALERAIEENSDKDYTSDLESALKNKLTTFKPDIVIFQFAENAAAVSTKSTVNAFRQFGEYCKNTVPGIQVVYCTPALGSEAKAIAIRKAAEETGCHLAELIKFNKPEYKAVGQFSHAGVAGHPSDKGMEAIGTDLAKTVNVLIGKLLNPQQVVVKVDNVFVDCSEYGVLPQIIDGRTMVPLRSIFEALGTTVEWHAPTSTAKSTIGDDTVEITIGEKKIKKNGEYLETELDVPAQIVDNRTLVPVRAISEAYDCTVEWDADTRTVLIKKPKTLVNVISKIENDPCDNLTKSSFYAGGAIEIVKDPEDDTNNVIQSKSVADGKRYSYVWSKMIFTAGATYKVEFDARLVSGYNGEQADKGYVGVCFHTKGADKGVGGVSVTTDKWSHCSILYTIPSDYEYIEDDDRFGIYGDPINDKSAVFLVDNITVIPITEETIAAEKQKQEEEKLAALASLKKVFSINYNNADDFIAENIGETVYAENSVKGTALNSDPKFTYKKSIDVNIDNVTTIIIKAKIPENAQMEMFFGTAESPNLAEAKKFTAASLGDEMTTYIINTSRNSEWKGILKTFRLDPVTKEGLSFEVESVEFLSK